MVLRRQQGDVWASGGQVGQPPAQHGQEEVDIEGIRVPLVGEEEEVDVEVGDAVEGGQADLATQPPPQLPAAPQLPSLEELHTTLVPTLKWCPKAARGEGAS